MGIYHIRDALVVISEGCVTITGIDKHTKEEVTVCIVKADYVLWSKFSVPMEVLKPEYLTVAEQCFLDHGTKEK